MHEALKAAFQGVSLSKLELIRSESPLTKEARTLADSEPHEYNTYKPITQQNEAEGERWKPIRMTGGGMLYSAAVRPVDSWSR
jgi:hypothetical protein